GSVLYPSELRAHRECNYTIHFSGTLVSVVVELKSVELLTAGNALFSDGMSCICAGSFSETSFRVTVKTAGLHKTSRILSSESMRAVLEAWARMAVSDVKAMVCSPNPTCPASQAKVIASTQRLILPQNIFRASPTKLRSWPSIPSCL